MRSPSSPGGRDIALLTYGTRGDVEPFLALAVGLQRAGFRPRLAAPAIYASLAAEYAIPFEPLPGDLAALARDMVTKAGTNWLRTVVTISRFIAPLAAQAYRRMIEWAEGADLIVHSFLTTQAGFELAEKQGIPSISAQFFPAFAPTVSFPAPIFPNLPLGALYRRMTHEIVTQIFRRGGGYLYGRLRRQDPALPRLRGWPFDAAGPSRPLILFAFSRHVLPRAPEWSGIAEVTGYWTLGTPPGWSPPVELERFLDQGEAPVYVGLGSGGSAAGGAWVAAAQAALQQLGLRGLLDLGPSNPAETSLPSSILAVHGIPHTWLFPRVAAVVHHGGAGTTGAGLGAGRPTVIIPTSSDQPFWGWRVQALGVGPRPIPVRRLSPARLSRAIQAVTTDGAMRERAARLGAQMRLENGVERTILRMQEVLARRSRPMFRENARGVPGP